MIKSIGRAAKRQIEYVKSLPKLFLAGHFLRKVKKNIETIYIVCPYGIGDTLFVASLIRDYKIHYSIKRVCLIVKESHKDLPDFFCGVDEKIISTKMVDYLSTYAKRNRRFCQDNFRYGHFILDFGWPEPGQMLGIKKISLIDVYKRCVLRLPMDARLECPKVHVSSGEMLQFQERFSSLKKVVLLMPFAITVERLKMQFWEQLTKHYKEQGYKVYTNTKDEYEKPIPGTEGIWLSLKELYIVSRTFKWECVALRSGICDLLGFSDVKLTVIHENQALADGWNMHDLNLPNQQMVDLVLSANDSIEENVEKILKS